MKIVVLSRKASLYSTRRIVEAAKARDHKVRVCDPLKFSIYVEAKRSGFLYSGRKLRAPDAIVPRIGASVTFYGLAVVRHFERMGVFSLNTADGIGTARDKLRSLQVLAGHGVPVPPTAFVRRENDLIPAVRSLGGAPVIIKLLEGTQGIGVILAHDESIAAAIVETMQSTKQNVLIQKFVAESRGTDVRAFVVGGRVVAAMRRTAKAGEFRSNVHRGASTLAIPDLDPEYRRVAVEAAHVHGLDVAGVDLLEGADGPMVMEVNSSPGLEGIEGASGVDVAGAIIEHLEQRRG